MSSAAHSIAGAEFHTEYLGEPALKGVDEPLGVFRADRSRGSNEGPVLEWGSLAAPLVGQRTASSISRRLPGIEPSRGSVAQW